MPRTIIIGCAPTQDMYSVLQRALQLLRSAGIKVDAAAQNVQADLPATATILLRDVKDIARAVTVLERAGVAVHI